MCEERGESEGNNQERERNAAHAGRFLTPQQLDVGRGRQGAAFDELATNSDAPRRHPPLPIAAQPPRDRSVSLVATTPASLSTAHQRDHQNLKPRNNNGILVAPCVFCFPLCQVGTVVNPSFQGQPYWHETFLTCAQES